jgi:3-dehydroquinate synthase
MLCEAWISRRQNHFPEAEFRETEEALRRFYEPVSLSAADLPELLRYMQNDKKNTGGQTRFTLLNRIGDAAFDCAVATETIEEALSYYMQAK